MPSETAVDLVAGCIGGAAGVLAGYPLDTVKTRLQTQQPGTYRSPWHCFTSIIKQDRARGLFKGLSSPLSSLTLVNAIVFGVHGAVSKQFEDQKAISTHFIAGCAAGIAQAFVAGPTELLKVRLQVPGEFKQYRSPYHCLRYILQESGPSKLFRGMWATQVRDAPAIGIYFASYEFLVRRMSKDGTMESVTSLQLLISGGLAGMSSWVCSYPADVIKTRFQASDQKTSYAEVIRKTYAENGLKTFFVGFGTTLLRAFPTNAVTFFTVEWTYRILLDYDLIGCMRHQLLQVRRPLVHAEEMWQRNMLFLPEAGGTLLEPMFINNYRITNI